MPLRIAIVGTGSVARSNYLPFLARQEDVSLTYLSRTRSRAEACAAEFGGRVVDSPRELLDGGPDAVLVLTKEDQRAEATAALLEHRPRRLFFEKPLLARRGQAHVTEEDFFEARALLARAREAGAETAMIFNYRFLEQTGRARRLVKERGLGRAVQVTALVHYACWSHCIDLVHLFAGPASEMVALEGGLRHQWSRTEAADAVAAFRLASGAAGTILGTCGMDFRFPLFEMTFGFERGRIRFRGLDGEMELLDYAGSHHESCAVIRHHSRWDQYRSSFERSLAAYLDSIRRGASPPVPGRAGLEELQFEAALRRSARERRPVDVQAEFALEG